MLAELYDLEHDEVTHDLVFYREMAGRASGAILDLGCGSGRLFRSFLDAGAKRVLGIDGSPELIDRARSRIAADAVLASAAADGWLELVTGDVRRLRRPDRFGLAVLAGLLAHLAGPADAVAVLASVAAHLLPNGFAIIDTLGPGGVPERDLPMSVDWRRTLHGREVVRSSELVRRDVPEGVRVEYSTLVDAVRADGTIARLPASFRLWYPSPSALLELVAEAGMVVDATYGSHDLGELDRESDRCIVIARGRGKG